jgi:hypothetical protein
MLGHLAGGEALVTEAAGNCLRRDDEGAGARPCRKAAPGTCLQRQAAQQHTWIIEDEYDSELHCGGKPMPALRGLDEAGRVLYLGTFSKLLFASLRQVRR